MLILVRRFIYAYVTVFMSGFVVGQLAITVYATLLFLTTFFRQLALLKGEKTRDTTYRAIENIQDRITINSNQAILFLNFQQEELGDIFEGLTTGQLLRAFPKVLAKEPNTQFYELKTPSQQ